MFGVRLLVVGSFLGAAYGAVSGAPIDAGRDIALIGGSALAAIEDRLTAAEGAAPPLPARRKLAAARAADSVTAGGLSAPAGANFTPISGPSISRVEIASDGTARFAGIGSSGAEVILRRNGESLGSAVADRAGNWQLEVERRLGAGEHRIEAVSRAPGGGRQVAGGDVRIAIPRQFEGGPLVAFERPEAETARERKAVEADMRQRTGEIAQAPPVPPESRVPQRADGPPRQASPDASGWEVLDYDRLMFHLQEWLARANREYQREIVRRLQVPPPPPGEDEERVAKEVTTPEPERPQARESESVAAPPNRTEQTPRGAEGTAKDMTDAMRAATERVEAERVAAEKAAAERAAREQAAAEKLAAERAAAEKTAEAERLAAERAAAEKAAQAKAAAEKEAAERAAAEKKAAAERLAAEKAAAEKAARAKAAAEKEAAERAAAEKKAAAERLAAEKAAAERAAQAKAAADKEAADRAAVEKRAAAERLAAEMAARERTLAEKAADEKAAAARAASDRASEASKVGGSSTVAEAPRAKVAKPADVPAPARRPTAVAGMLEEHPAARPADRLAAPEGRPVSGMAAHGQSTNAGRGSLKDGPSPTASHSGEVPDRVAAKRPTRASDHACRGRAGRRVRPPGTYTVATGDSLWQIASRHYGRGYLYPVIYRANTRKIDDPDLIFPCQRLFIPRHER
ncbi:MAG: LysM peptidoglycan-binding domain-containing protein [Hyphomicrobiaceae bacterium]|nr:LysM peptidoglycan-binding domain-containing protein [Hyphomicrobiaceae bacterium]